MEKSKCIKISIDIPDIGEMKLKIPQDSGLSDWENLFKTILTFVTFDSLTINELFSSNAEIEENTN